MLKLLAVLRSMYSCQGSRFIPAGTDLILPLEKRIILSATSQAAAGEAQSIIHFFCPPSRMQITDMGTEYDRIASFFSYQFPASLSPDDGSTGTSTGHHKSKRTVNQC
jgi:hypothetical protein